MKRNLFLIIMMLFVITSISNVYAQEMKEEIFLKNSENTRDEINLRKHFLKDLIQNKKTLEIKSFKQSNKLEHKSISEAGLNKNSLQGASFENIDVIKFPEIEINKKLVKLYPESTKTRDEILSINKNFYELLRQDIKNKLEIDVSIEDLSDQSKIDYFMLSYLGLDSINLDRADVVSFFDAISLTNNTDRNNHTLYLIYNEKLDQFDEEVTEPVEIQNENSNLSITDTNKSENSFFRNSFQTYSSYNRWDAANYAISWWHLTNNMDYPYYARYYKYDTNRNDYNQLPYDGYENKSQSNPRRGWNDCTNFVSQALAAGGLQQNSDWKYRDSGFFSKPTHSWGGAANFYEVFRDRFGLVGTNNVTVGDVGQLIYQNANVPFHTMIITRDSGSGINNKYVTYHTTDRRDMNANQLFGMYERTVYFYFYHIY